MILIMFSVFLGNLDNCKLEGTLSTSAPALLTPTASLEERGPVPRPPSGSKTHWKDF
jgi:hypothetical protein